MAAWPVGCMACVLHQHTFAGSGESTGAMAVRESSSFLSTTASVSLGDWCTSGSST